MISKKNVNTTGADIIISDAMSSAMELWDKMYKNKSPWLGENVLSLNLPSAIASEFARLVTLEMHSGVFGEGRGQFLDSIYQKVISRLRRYVEYGCASGGIVFKPIAVGDTISVDFVQADSFFPISFDSNDKITGAVFVDSFKQGKSTYTRLETHSLNVDGVTVKNAAYKSENDELGIEIPLNMVEKWANLQPEVLISGVTIPLFAYFKVPYANTIDTHSPLGVSVYSRAAELIEQADKQYSRLIWEFEGSELALDVDITAVDQNGSLPSLNNRLFRGLDVGEDSFYNVFAPTIRDTSLINGLNEILTKIEDTCGLARGSFSDPSAEAKTATELKILRQRSYASVADIQKSLEDALSNLVDIMDVYATLYSLCPKGEFNISFEWDDSIISDRNSEFDEKVQLINLGVMKPFELRMWYFGETAEVAKASL